MFSVNMLMYGDHYHLAARCLGGLVNNADWQLISEVRVGLNDVCGDTDRYVREVCSRIVPSEIPTYVYRAEKKGKPINALKYPLMGRMLRDATNPVDAEYVMWFDDDSFITATDQWWPKVAAAMKSADMLGHIYGIRQRGEQHLHIRRQPWFAKKDINPRHRYRFATGGWWVIRREVLEKWNYPFPGLRHRGGDAMLGELLRQQDYRLKNWSEGVAVNALDATSADSTSPRRGVDEDWYLQAGNDELTPNDHQEFDVDVWKPGGKPDSPALLRLP